MAQAEQANKEFWLERSLEKLQGDLPLFAIADSLMRDWCSKLGGVPDDPGKQVELRCAFDVAAERELDRLMAMPDDFRRALAHRLWPASRGQIRSLRSGLASPHPDTAGSP